MVDSNSTVPLLMHSTIRRLMVGSQHGLREQGVLLRHEDGLTIFHTGQADMELRLLIRCIEVYVIRNRQRALLIHIYSPLAFCPPLAFQAAPRLLLREVGLPTFFFVFPPSFNPLLPFLLVALWPSKTNDSGARRSPPDTLTLPTADGPGLPFICAAAARP